MIFKINIIKNINMDKISNKNNQFNSEQLMNILSSNIINIISNKMNNIQIINDELIEELCNNFKFNCENHNKMIIEWFDNNYNNDLEQFKTNNNKYNQISNTYNEQSVIIID